MNSLHDSTQQYYTDNSRQFFDETCNLDMSSSYDLFLRDLRPGDSILDLGCGSGRDTKKFRDAGFQVEAWEPNESLATLAENYLKHPVRRASTANLCTNDQFHGIWCSASLLHLTFVDLKLALRKIAMSLLPRGVFYSSFKWGEGDQFIQGRYFLMMNEDRLKECFQDLPDVELRKIVKRPDPRPQRQGQFWLEILASRKI